MNPKALRQGQNRETGTFEHSWELRAILERIKVVFQRASRGHQISRSEHCQTAHFHNQSIHLASTRPCQVVSVSLTVRTVLLIDPAAPAYQGVVRHLRERRRDANLDRPLGLRAGRHRQKAPQWPLSPYETLPSLSP